MSTRLQWSVSKWGEILRQISVKKKLKRCEKKVNKILVYLFLSYTHFLSQDQYLSNVLKFIYCLTTLIRRLTFTCTINSSPNCEKYCLKSSSVLFQGKPNTIRSLHFLLTLLALMAPPSMPSSLFLLLSVQYNTTTINTCQSLKGKIFHGNTTQYFIHRSKGVGSNHLKIVFAEMCARRGWGSGYGWGQHRRQLAIQVNCQGIISGRSEFYMRTLCVIKGMGLR